MPELKTKQTTASVEAFLQTVEDDQQRADSWALVDLLRDVTGEEPRLWGPSIVGFGSYHYRYASGHEGDAALVGFSPRKQALTLYLMGCLDQHPDLVAQLGKYKAGKGCVYVKRLQDVNLEVLREMAQKTVTFLKETYG